jgi:imidazole glycerol-phosphate synthase subunit HisH
MSYVAIVDYGSGNLRSAAKAFERAARECGAALDTRVTSDPAEVAGAERIVLPGVGAFADCRAGLYGVPGMVDALQQEVIERGKPFLGICVGMQLMASRGVEYGTHPGLDWIAGDVVRLEPDDPGYKIPHMGWNELDELDATHPILAGIAPGEHAYFVHSYKFDVARPEHCLAQTDHGGTIAAVVGRDNLAGTQFHPEKSQTTGLRLIANFLRWRP